MAACFSLDLQLCLTASGVGIAKITTFCVLITHASSPILGGGTPLLSVCQPASSLKSAPHGDHLTCRTSPLGIQSWYSSRQTELEPDSC